MLVFSNTFANDEGSKPFGFGPSLFVKKLVLRLIFSTVTKIFLRNNVELKLKGFHAVTVLSVSKGQ